MSASPDPDMIELSLVLPAYNEAERLPRALDRYLADLPEDPARTEIVLVDDGSTDATSAVIAAAATRDPRVRALRIEHAGKGAAVRAGMLNARGRFVVFTDADGAYTAEQVQRVAAALSGAAVAIGARHCGSQEAESFARHLASRLYNRVMRGLIGLPYRDTQCGVKGFTQEAARAIFTKARVNGFAFDAEALLLAHQLRLRIAEVPVEVIHVPGSKVGVVRGAVQVLLDIWRVRCRIGTASTKSPGRAHSHPRG